MTDRLQSPATLKDASLLQSIDTSETVIALGDIASPGGFMLVNRNATNYVDIYNASSGVHVARLRPDTESDGTGGFCLISELGADMQSPVGIANDAPCIIEIFAISI